MKKRISPRPRLLRGLADSAHLLARGALGHGLGPAIIAVAAAPALLFALFTGDTLVRHLLG